MGSGVKGQTSLMEDAWELYQAWAEGYMEAEEQLCVLLAGTLQFLIKFFGLFV